MEIFQDSTEKRHSIILNRETTALLIIDIQEKIAGVMQNSDQVIQNACKLTSALKLLNVPIYYTEQYPKGLGATVEPLKVILKDTEAKQKMTFSCCGADDLFKVLLSEGYKNIIVVGIEAHVCVQQTVLDLLSNNFSVSLCADAVSSRKEIDYTIALRRMERLGADITTTEAVLFELLEKSGTDEFKAVSKIIK